MTPKQRTIESDPLFAVRAAYQLPVVVTLPDKTESETAYPYTFEDALAFANLDFFKDLAGTGLVKKFRAAIANGGTAAEIGALMFDALRSGKKAEFALDIIDADGFEKLAVPHYIADGLSWLEGRLKKKQIDILPAASEEDS